MRLSKSFGKTLREQPAEVEMASHSLSLRAGLISRLASGIYSYLPFAWKSVRKIEAILRKEIEAVGGQELNMPVVNPGDIWKESGRWDEIGPEMARFKDRSGRDMCLAMTHEEPVTDLARRFIDSYKQLPCVVYHIQTKFRDEPRSRGGLVRVREFIMKDAYSFHADQSDLNEYYPKMCRVYEKVCSQCGVPVAKVLSDVGMMGGSMAHEFMYITNAGEDTLITCSECGYAANREVAVFNKDAENKLESDNPTILSLTKVHTPGKDTISSVTEYLGINATLSIKTMAYFTQDSEQAVIVLIRGDLDINERKLANFLHTPEVRLASPEELESLGLVQGFMSPIGIEGIKVVADDSIVLDHSYIAGANQQDYHFINVIPSRDFSICSILDIAEAREGDRCVHCNAPLIEARGIEIGNTFMLGVRYSKAMKANFQDKCGGLKPLVMGCYGMGVGRLLACVLEENRDEKGIVWPITVAPYHIHLVSLGSDDQVQEISEKTYTRLKRNGFEILYDDRDESAGVKFNDADLLGMPIRVTISNRSLKAGGAEVKLRRENNAVVVPLKNLEDKLAELKTREFSLFDSE